MHVRTLACGNVRVYACQVFVCTFARARVHVCMCSRVYVCLLRVQVYDCLASNRLRTTALLFNSSKGGSLDVKVMLTL